MMNLFIKGKAYELIEATAPEFLIQHSEEFPPMTEMGGTVYNESINTWRYKSLQINGKWYGFKPTPNPSQVFFPVKAVTDEDGHWYVLPQELEEQFSKDLCNEELVDTGEFGNRYDQYRTGGDLNNTQLYAKL